MCGENAVDNNRVTDPCERQARRLLDRARDTRSRRRSPIRAPRTSSAPAPPGPRPTRAAGTTRSTPTRTATSAPGWARTCSPARDRRSRSTARSATSTATPARRFAVQSLWSNAADEGTGYCAGAGTDSPIPSAPYRIELEARRRAAAARARPARAASSARVPPPATSTSPSSTSSTTAWLRHLDTRPEKSHHPEGQEDHRAQEAPAAKRRHHRRRTRRRRHKK